jgi:hypothetical protein
LLRDLYQRSLGLPLSLAGIVLGVRDLPVARISRGAARQNNHNFGSKLHTLIISNNSAWTHPLPCLESRLSVFASLPFRIVPLLSSFTCLRPSLDIICPSSMNRPIPRPAASCLNIPASGRRAVAFLFHFWRCYSTFRRSVARRFRPSCIVLHRRVHCPSTCLALSFLSVIALMFSVRP